MLGVEDQVGDNLTELVRIAAKHRQVGSKLGGYLDTGRADPIPDKFERSADDLVQVDWLFLGTALACHRKKALDDAAATLRRSPDSRGALRQLAAAILLEQQCLTDDDRQRVVELMRDPGQQRSERAHLFTLVEAVALAGDFTLRLLLLGQISDMRRKECTPGDLGRGDRQLGRELIFTAKRRNLDSPIENAAVPGGEVAGHAGVMRCTQPLRN